MARSLRDALRVAGGTVDLAALRELDPRFPRPELDVPRLTAALAPPDWPDPDISRAGAGVGTLRAVPDQGGPVPAQPSAVGACVYLFFLLTGRSRELTIGEGT